MDISKAKIALVFDWTTIPGGAEKINLLFHKMFPEAQIFTSIYNPKKVKGFENANIKTSFIQNLPFAKTRHQLFLGLMPYAYESFDLSQFDIVISSSHSCAKGVITKPETMHICYCHSPMRYAWDNWQRYLKEYRMNSLAKRYGKRKMHKIRIWDKITADRVDYYIANSEVTQKRIKKYYRKDSKIINPCIKTANFLPAVDTKGYYLAGGRLTNYKKFDLIIDTFNKTGLPLKIFGEGHIKKQLMSKANSNIEFLGYIDNKSLKTIMSECEALIFPQEEDFGIIMLEVMASGRPVIAYNGGGAKEIIEHMKTGILFEEQTEKSLIEALENYQDNKKSFIPLYLNKQAEKFDESVFIDEFMGYLSEKWKEYSSNTRRK